mmetsp:Transcript_85652/g.239280  ORF Transcript_85652/g.239280 Transcript_85652/m.239280 type:complete len:111 (+) Transcript_85652:2242-2574(+)
MVRERPTGGVTTGATTDGGALVPTANGPPTGPRLREQRFGVGPPAFGAAPCTVSGAAQRGTGNARSVMRAPEQAPDAGPTSDCMVRLLTGADACPAAGSIDARQFDREYL